MKKRFLSVAIVATLCGSMLMTSCIGSFSLTNKLLAWNKGISNKFVNEVVFLAFWILPVYEVSGLADFLVINSIEFWSGSNPVASVGNREVVGQDGRKYLVECDTKGYTITDETSGAQTRLDYDTANTSWSVTAPDGNTYELMTFVDDTHVSMPACDGSRITVELSEAGVLAYEQMAMQMQPMALR